MGSELVRLPKGIGVNPVVNSDTSVADKAVATTSMVAQGGTIVLELRTIVGGTTLASDTDGATSAIVPGSIMVLGPEAAGRGLTLSSSFIKASP